MGLFRLKNFWNLFVAILKGNQYTEPHTESVFHIVSSQ